MLDSLRPAHALHDEVDSDEDEAHEHEVEIIPQGERPQFVLGNEVDVIDGEDKAEKGEVEHREVARGDTSEEHGRVEEGQKRKGEKFEDVPL